MVTAVALISGCGRNRGKVDVTGTDARVEVERFDLELFGINPDSTASAIDRLYARYGDFFDVFNVHVINIGDASSRRYASYLSMFINDPTNREVFEYTAKEFRDMEAINTRLGEGFSHYIHHYPDSLPPRVVGYVSRFNQGLLTVGNFVGVGLDQYLGADCPYYTSMGTPRYLALKKEKSRIPLDVMLAWATRLYPYNDSVDNLLNRMIHQGQLYWFLGKMYPGAPDGALMGFTEDQMRWCRNNEEQMWTYLVENKLLFSTEPMTIRKLIQDAPHTSYYTPESPGRAAVWQGLQIVRAFEKRNGKISVAGLMAIDDYQELLRRSRYSP